MTAESFFASAPAAIAKAKEDGEAPRSLTITSALYLHLRPDREWHDHASRAQYGYEPARPVLGLPVKVEPGAHHSWSLRCESGACYDERGRVVYSSGPA